jgi:hypothetical protein
VVDHEMGYRAGARRMLAHRGAHREPREPRRAAAVLNMSESGRVWKPLSGRDAEQFR